MDSLALACMPSLIFIRSEKPVSHSIHPALTHSLMPFPGFHGRQPFQNLVLLVRYRYLAVVPHILVTVSHITDVLVNINGRVPVCFRIHLVSPMDLLVVGGGGSGNGAVGGSQRIKPFFVRLWEKVVRAKKGVVQALPADCIQGSRLNFLFLLSCPPPKPAQLKPGTRVLSQPAESAQRLL